ncbi:unnamed protein product [Aureobasidium uvarum]|uniref:Uncharacterized protein n=1 Tax=Aureobasidium uvarum TaxID=2773716 RepID=A0A9N8KI08_9PEZI|nr:unnamed protein product [Aureobasidium uvarum]
MASPLSPLDSQQLNSRTPATAVREDKMATNSVAATRCRTSTPTKQTHEESIINWDDEDVGSSPFVAEADNRAASNNLAQVQVGPEVDAIFEDAADPSDTQFFETEDKKASTFSMSSIGEKENTVALDHHNDDKEHKTPKTATTPEPSRRSMSPLKPKSTIKKRRSSTFEEDTAQKPPPSTRKTLRFNSPLKASSPVKQIDFASATPLPHSRDPSSPDNIDDSIMIHDVDETGVDDTCFSTFSAVPDMTMFAKLGDRRSPLKQSIQQTPQSEQATPRPIRRRASDERSPSPTPRRPRTPGTAQSNTINLIDFTQQIERFAHASDRGHVQQTPSRRSPQKSSTEPNLLSYLNQQRSPGKGARMSTPAKSTSLLNLLDFELPPAPTPRSIPTITVRELESMKSQYQSQISSLKATLSGREAEVDSLKKAVGDAERRVGEALENLREEKGQREQIEHEKNQWEQRGVEFEHLLQNVRQEVMRSDEEKESLIRRAEESERLTEKQQTRADEAESKVLDLEAQLATARAAIPKNDGSGNMIDEAQIQHLVQQQIDAKVEAVSRELHAVYKKKHETKVATLKKSYEARGEKKCAELQTRLDELTKHNEELAAAANNNVESSMMFTADDRRVMEEANSTIEEQRAHLANLDRQLQVMRNEQADLIRELEKERVEKGELVAAVDEMLLLQSSAPDGNTAAIEDFRRSISRPAPPPHASVPAFREQPSAPAPVQSRIGRGMPRPSGIASKSKMMSNIERMGNLPKH